MTRSVDVAVVGGGPAGAVAARACAEAGLATRLLEREAMPRYKTCGGGLVGRARRALGVALDGAVERECRRAEMWSLEDGFRIEVERDEPIVTMTMRATLDARLVEAARAAGAEVEAPCELRGLAREGDVLALATSAGALRARWVIACDGALSPTARLAGWPPHRAAVPALESEVRVDDATLARFAETARFDFGAVAAGYSWVFPKRGHLSVGCLRADRAGGRAGGLRAELDRWLARIGIEPAERADHGFVVPSAPRPGPPAAGGVLLVGDALGLADPITLEGISGAARSARLAAGAIAAGAGRPDGPEAAYAAALARELVPEQASARRAARLVYGWPRLRRLVFRRAGRRLCERLVDVHAGRASYVGSMGARPAVALLALRAVARVGVPSPPR